MELCERVNARPKDMRCHVLLALLALLALQEASAACFKHVSCTSCIGESNEAGSCLWYQHPDLQGIGTCVAGRPEYSVPVPDHQQLTVDAYGTWSMVVPFTGETRHFTVPEIDQVSDDSCYTMRCVQSGTCDPGYLAVRNEPCYSDDVFPDWRTLTCCRQQRNINGYLRGYQAENGIILGKLWFASCCTVCYPGQVIKDCHAYDAGYCEDCPVGRFNLYTYAGSECEPCQPCEAGRVRRRCGPSTQGTCNECEAGKEYKLKGLEGSYTDPCLPCEECPTGHMRVGCGGASPGYCAPCQGGSFFAAPFCRNCFTCFPLERIRHGCGGQQQGVCTECSKGRYEDVSEACLECAQCTEPTSTELVEGLQLTGAWARIGCGGMASGRCVRMATGLELQDVPRCPSSVDTEALCEGSEIAARWSIQGLSQRQLDATYGDCTVATGLCLSGFFRVKLMQRQVDAFDGVEMAELGDFFSAELEHLSSLDGANAVMVKRGLQLPTGLPEASGYFLRVFFYDAGGSCCSAVSTNPLFADSEDFSLEGRELLVKEALELTSEDISGGLWEDAFARVSETCATTATPSSWIACETAKALQLGLPVGQRALLPMPLLHSAGSAEVAAMGAAFSVNEAGDRLVDIEQIYNAIVDKIPENATVWQYLMQPLFVGQSLVGSVGLLENTTTTSTMFPMFTAQEAKARLELLKSGAQELSTAATALHQQWASEISSGARLLPPKLQNLQEIDRLTGESTKNATFDVVRMAQAITWKLSHELSDMKNSATLSLDDKETKMGELLQRIGSMALMLLGTWGNSWYHGIDWRLKCQVREGDELQWPPLMTGSALGGAEPPPGAIPVAEARNRLWKNFEEVAQSCFSYADELLLAISTRTTTTASTTPTGTTPTTSTTPVASTTEDSGGSRRLSFSTRSLDRVLPMVRKVLVEVEGFTEQVVEPLTRDGALLLAGDLPNISFPGTGSCSVRGWCLSFATEFFDKDVILSDVWEGFGAQAVRPWIDPRIEDLRLKDASEEVLALVWGRLRILEEILLEVVDLRYVQQQPSIGSEIASSSEKLSMHLSRLLTWSEAPQNVTILSDRPDALWHWQELKRLQTFLTAARRSAALLARRRLGRIEALAAWLARQRDDGYFLGPAGWSWRQPWTAWSPRQPGSSSGAFFAANDAARNKLQQSIDDQELLAATSGSQAYLRIDATSTNRPVAFAGLLKSGSTILRIRAPGDKPHLMMHAEAKAFLLSPDNLVSPLQAGEETGEAPSGTYAQAHVELRLKRLVGAFDVTNTAVEPTMEGSLPFVTRHERRNCEVLPEVFAERHPEIVPAALLPLDGFWVLTARDGTNARFLNIDEGTTIRLLFQLDVPSGTPPWRLLEDTTDVLYKLPGDGVCENLQPIFGTWPETSTFPPTTRTTLYTVTATTRAVFLTTTRDPVVVIPAEDEGLVLAPRLTTIPPRAAPKEPWTPPVWLWAGLFVLALAGCGLGVRFYIKRRRRRLLEVLPEELEEGKGKKDEKMEKVAPTILQENRDGTLRGAADAKSSNQYAMAKKNAKKQASKKGSSWEISDTPRDKDEDDAWSEASTPEGSEESGGSSRSGSASDSGGSHGSHSSPAVSPRTALAQKALQQHMQQFSPEQLAANALGSHAHRFSTDQIAANALEAHAAQLADRGASKTSKATAQFGPQPRLPDSEPMEDDGKGDQRDP